VLKPLLATEFPGVEIITVQNDYFGGNIGVTGLMTGSDLAAELSSRTASRRYLLPDVCLSEGRFLDGLTPDELPRPVEIVETTGPALRRALESSIAKTRRSIPVLSR
jgi:NifB/MoaA-like Fe-S oxidoreductase